MLLLIPIVLGLARLRFDAEVLDLLPAKVPAVTGLKLYQQHFTNARELIITVQGTNADEARAAAQAIAMALRPKTNLVASITWQPPWLEHPEQAAELIAFLWYNQPPSVLDQLAGQLAATNLPTILAATRDQLSTTLSPMDLAQWSHDPYGLTRLPTNLIGSAPELDTPQGEAMFASPNGSFRIVFVQARGELKGYRECTEWFDAIKATVAPMAQARIGYTGRPAFVAEISASMRRDITLSVGGTAVIIAGLFWLAHRRWRPMLWLLTLLAIILVATLAFGSLIFGTVNVISMGFAAILLGLAVDYAVVHYQEALAHPKLSIPQIRRSIAPSIFWAATTTISAFLVLNFGGLPGLAQLGSLVAIGVALSALVMIFAFLPPLFPDRMQATSEASATEASTAFTGWVPPRPVVFAGTVCILVAALSVLSFGLPRIDGTADALQPRNSQAYAALNAIKDNLAQKTEPLWLVIRGGNETEVARQLDGLEPILARAVSNQTLTGFTLPAALWPHHDYQIANQSAIKQLVAERGLFLSVATNNGFSGEALGLTDGILDAWAVATANTNIFWPTNPLCSWIYEKLVARDTNQFYAAAFLYPGTNVTGISGLENELPRQNVWLSSWTLLGGNVLAQVKSNQWKLLVPMVSLVVLSLWLAFRRINEIILSVGMLALSGICLLAVMKLSGWSWNLLNLMALPLILGTGVDYSIFIQLALRRYRGDQALAYHSVGRALLLCGGTAIAGFGSLGLSSNAGMASLGRVCAVGIGGNMLFSIFLLPACWQIFCGAKFILPGDEKHAPSQFYRAGIWRIGLWLVHILPTGLIRLAAKIGAAIYWRIAAHRREILIKNLRPVLAGNRALAKIAARKLCTEFAIKLADLWRYESGVSQQQWFTDWNGWEIFAAAQARGRGVLLVTPHLGNWELGGAFMTQHGCQLLVLTQAEPDPHLTVMRQASRARWGVETLVVGSDAFAIVEIIRRLQAGATIALLVDRPPPPTAVTVELFGQPFFASIAAAELARASGCAIVPTYIVRESAGYCAEIMPEITYDRARIGDRAARIQLTQEILRAFEPAIRQHITQWYHFVPIWRSAKK
jgi:predicted exporter/lauroyl/myristoyl acyltransferase